MNYRICTVALALLPLALAIGCEKKQSKEEIIAEYEAQKAAEDRVDKLQQELDEFKAQAAENAQAQQLKEEQQKVLEKQIQDAKKKADEAAKAAEEAKKGVPPPQQAAAPGGATDESGRRNRGDGGDRERRPAQNIVVSKGTQISVMLSEELSTDKNKAADSWAGSLANDVTINNAVVWKAGSPVKGIISQSTPTGRLANGDGILAIRLSEIDGVAIDGGIYAVQGNSKGARNAKVIGTTTALGAIVGILSNKNNQTDHALGGAAIGAALGTAVAGATGDTVIRMPVANAVLFSVPSDETVTLRNRSSR
ncbi:MAG: hypothetical protein LBC63_10020 [Holophagales bacterium]|jgi:hypothetical protein|nr:hypothetical protein [Holophagales bacterium]